MQTLRRSPPKPIYYESYTSVFPDHCLAGATNLWQRLPDRTRQHCRGQTHQISLSDELVEQPWCDKKAQVEESNERSIPTSSALIEEAPEDDKMQTQQVCVCRDPIAGFVRRILTALLAGRS